MVIPLAAAILVCLLATSGVWFITADDGEEQRGGTPIGLNVPDGMPVPEDSGVAGLMTGKAMPPGKPKQTSASPSPSPSTPTASTPNTPSASNSGTKPASSAPAGSTAPAPPPAPPSRTTQPPPPRPPTTAPTTTPPTTAPPKPQDYAVTSSASKERRRPTLLTITVANPNATPLGAWRIEIDDSDIWWITVESGHSSVQFSNGNAVAVSGGLTGATQISFTLKLWASTDELSYTFNGRHITVPVQRG